MVWWGLLLPGCIEVGLDPIDDTDPPAAFVQVQQSFVQSSEPAVDVLFVIDDTLSMAQEQSTLATEFAGLWALLDAEGVAWHMGVVTTDMSGDAAGWLLGSPFVLTSSSPDASASFAALVQVGTGGAVPEAGLAAAVEALALAEPGGPNAGFRRQDAALHIVFVSDADDGSDLWLGSDPESAFLAVVEAERAASGREVRASAIVGDVPTGCTSEGGTAQSGERYVSVAEQTGGLVASICATEFDALVQQVAVVPTLLSERFPLDRAPIPGSVRVTIDEIPVEGWVLDDADPAVVFEQAPPASSRIVVSYLVENA